MKKNIILILLVLLALPAAALAQTPNSDFVQANSDYRQGKYSKAIAGYEKLLNSDIQSGPVYYNLANSYFKNKELGKAILNYERALKFSPRDGDLAANLKFALSSVPARVEPSLNFIEKIFSSHVRFYTVNEMILILVLLGVFLAVAHLGGLYFNWPLRGSAIMILALGVIVFATGLSLKLNLEKDASIVIKATSARFEPNDKATVYFELPEGQKVRWQSKEGDWLKIQRPDGKIGWVPLQTVEKI